MGGGGLEQGSPGWPGQRAPHRTAMRLLLLLCLAVPATRSSVKQEESVSPSMLAGEVPPTGAPGVRAPTHAVSLLTETAHKVLEVVPRGRQVLIRHHSPGVQPSISSSLWGGGATEITKKGVGTYGPASNTIGVTLTCRPAPLTYACRAASTWEPVSQLLVNFILLDGGPSGPWVKVSCWASSGSPPITYSLVGRDSGTYMKQTQNYKEAANFSFPLTQTSCWLRCQAANNISAQHSALTLVPPGKLPEGPTFVLAVSTVAVLSTVAVISGRLSRARHLSFPDARHPHQVEEINFLMILRTRPPDLLAPQG